MIGGKLPSYINIAKEAGSSPETVRKALRELQRHGVVEKLGWDIL
ncbi:GntR family transcriptional regulator [Robinsoniella peoriensis]